MRVVKTARETFTGVMLPVEHWFLWNRDDQY